MSEIKIKPCGCNLKEPTYEPLDRFQIYAICKKCNREIDLLINQDFVGYILENKVEFLSRTT